MRGHIGRNGDRYQRDAIKAHVIVVFAALAISRHLQEAVETSIKNIVQRLRPMRSVVIGIREQIIVAGPTFTSDPCAILERLPPITLGH